MADQDFLNSMKQAYKDAEQKYFESVERIEVLAKKFDASSLFTIILATLILRPSDIDADSSDDNSSVMLEMLAYHVYHFFDISLDKDIKPWDTSTTLEALNQLYISWFQLHLFADIEVQKITSPDQELVRSLKTHIEMVRGSAYPEQTSEEITSIQGKFENWFEKRVGIGPQKAQKLLFYIMEVQEKNANVFIDDMRTTSKAEGDRWEKAFKKRNNERSEDEIKLLKTFKDKKTAQMFGFAKAFNEIVPEKLPVSYKDLCCDGNSFTEDEWISFVSFLGLTKEKRASIVDYIGIKEFPVFVLPDGRALLSDISNALDVLWTKFEMIAKKDTVFYDKRYQKEKGKWLEIRAYNHLSKIFPSPYIYQHLSYPDPDKNDGSMAELDIAVKWGPFLILLEAKAKQFRLESQLGDVGRLRTDIKANVEDAFEQARRASRYVESVSNPEFIEISSGRKLSFTKKSIRRTYLITVSQHHLAWVATRLALSKGLGLFKDGDYPFSLCDADLDTITEHCPGPDVFLHYIEKRLEIQKESISIFADELDFFGAYLETRLQANRVWLKNGKPVDGVWLSGFSNVFDKWMEYKRGTRASPPAISLKIPKEIANILFELRKSNDYDSRWISFALLALSDQNLQKIDFFIKDLRKADLTPKMFRTVSHNEDETVVSIVGSLDLPFKELYQKICEKTIIEKYRHKASKSVGIGIMTNDKSRPFSCICWIEGQWQHDGYLDKIITTEPIKFPVAGQKLPGRNDPCFCGSGKKYKKCCLHKIEKSFGEGYKK